MPKKEKIILEFPEDLLALIAKRRKDVPAKILEFVVLELYRLGEISSGKAAEILGMERFKFIKYASRRSTPYLDMSEEELRKDYKHAKEIAGKK